MNNNLALVVLKERSLVENKNKFLATFGRMTLKVFVIYTVLTTLKMVI